MSRTLHNLEKRMEAERRARLAAGAEKISSDADCRYLIATLLNAVGAFENSGMGLNRFTPNALTTAHETGKMQTAQELVNLITAHVPHFYADLLKETLNEYERTAARIADATNGGDPADE